MLITKVSENNILKSKEINAYTAAAAAVKLNVSLRTTYNWLEAGLLQEVKLAGGDIVLIDGESVDKLQKQFELNPPKRGRKPKEAA